MVAGSAVTFVAIADTPSASGRFGRATAELAAASVPAAGAAEPVDAVDAAGWGLGSLRLQEAEQELAYRRDAIVAASRSAERPSLGWPSDTHMSGWYGERRGRRAHVGLDLDGETGDPVVAAGAGIVEWAGRAPSGYGGYGQMVLIRHSGGISTLYAHLSRIAVVNGAVLDAGDHVGAIGTTGNVTGSHLHFEVRYGGVPVNPRDWLPRR